MEPGVRERMLKSTTLRIRTPPRFDFEYTAHSHGWSVLPPNEWHEGVLKRVEQLPSGRVVALELSSGPGSRWIRIRIPNGSTLPNRERKTIKARVSHMLRLDEDLTGFHRLCEQRGGGWAKVSSGLGRLLRSPSVYEDVVKTICTTNIQWGGTKRMIQGLVAEFGEPIPGDPSRRAFPTAERLSKAPKGSFTDRVRLGYRGEYIRTLSERVASGELELEALQVDDRPTDELKAQLLSIKGVGEYAASTLLMLLGRYDYLAVDTVFRQFVSERYFDGQRPSDTNAKAIYDDWGEWKYLAYWYDIWSHVNESSADEVV